MQNFYKGFPPMGLESFRSSVDLVYALSLPFTGLLEREYVSLGPRYRFPLRGCI